MIPTGHPSAVSIGCTTCAGERWVSPGVGERFIAYLKRTYADYTPTHKRRHDGVNYNDLCADEPAPHEHGHLVTCADCGRLFRTVTAAKRCKPCADKRTETRIAEHTAERKKRRADGQT